MKDKIKEILEGLGIEDVDGTTDTIAKEIALLTVPKNKYNDISERLKNVQAEKTEIELELENVRTQNMTDEEKRAKEQAEFEKQKKELSVELNKVKAREVFKNANIDDDKIEELLGKVVSDNEETTLELANSFADILKTQVEDTKKTIESDLLSNTPKPDVKSQPNEPEKVTKEDFLRMSYSDKKKLFSTDKEQYNQLMSEISSSE